MAHGGIALLMLVVITFAPLLYGAVFCQSEKPMKRLVAWTEAVSKIAVVAITSLLYK
ncbi:hypothetical protein [Mycobacterium marseillense]|uniref:Uncharacterized protein n=2 Tax=Mycobacterium marseillense TaxID=701042 RepID=A0ABN5ZYW9_9MYCO|nr:hypothetical protein [Mycobacterium marseillense]MCV7406934.1 hypothetical protein [Mycobacterium marseillense]BBY13829.1 hypothetical protein MMARJ_45690 [Mycobacterium marseillense]